MDNTTWPPGGHRHSAVWQCVDSPDRTMSIERNKRIGWLLSALASELILWAGLTLVGWERTLALVYSFALLIVLVLTGWGLNVLLVRWSHNRFRFDVKQFLLGISLLCGLVAMGARFYARPFFDHYGVNSLRKIGVETYGLSVKSTRVPNESPGDADVAGIVFNSDAKIDNALVHLSRFPALEYIVLSGDVTGVGLKELADFQFPRSVTVNLMGSKLTDDGIRHLRRFRAATTIWINGPPISSDGIQLIAGMEHVRRLGLLQEGNNTLTQVGDETIASIAGMDQLNSLSIMGPKVTDDSIAAIGSLANLTTLHIWDTQISPEGILRLQSLLPECTIRVHRRARVTTESPDTAER